MDKDYFKGYYDTILEVWEPIKDYEGKYEISDFGRVKSLKRLDSAGRLVNERILSQSVVSGTGYLKVGLLKKSIQKTFHVHKLVAVAFLNHNIGGFSEVINHKNFNRKFNPVFNLETTTARENANKKHIKSSSKYVGVCWDKYAKKWKVQITIEKKVVHLGCYYNENDANKAYQNKLKELK